MRKKALTFIIGMLLSSFALQASHYMGGEIIWQCKTNGNFRFKLIVYRECDGITYPNTVSLQSNSPAGSIQMNLISRIDISPVCWDSVNGTNCNNVTAPNQGAVEEWTYTSDQSHPNGVQLNGVPPANGWYFAYNSCCRNPCTNIPNSSSIDWYLRAVMYPYNGWNNYPCWDDSPEFIEKPSTVIATGYPFTYNHNAYDKQLDSLTFEWAQPLDDAINNPITSYNSGYSYTSPLPGTFHNPNNVNATVNPNTGEISFTSFTQGAFVTVTKVTAFKCGVKIAEVFREMQIVLLPMSGTNYPPEVTAPFIDPATGLYTKYADTVYAGQTVSFLTSAIDSVPLYLPTGDLTTVELNASGSQFGQNFSSTSAGCLNPPCATLSPPPPIVSPFALSTIFDWQTSCAHLETSTGCGGVTNSYNFILKVFDNGCPAPAINVGTVTITVQNAILEEPEPRCVSVEENGDVILDWVPPDTSIIPNTFNSYHIYSSTNPNGPFVLVDSVFDYNTTSYTHLGANAATVPRYYYMRSRSGCYGNYYSGVSDTLHTINLSVSNIGNNTAELVWNQNHTPLLPSATGEYDVLFEDDNGSWVQVGQTTNLSFQHVVPAACGFLKFRVAAYDTSGCYSYSSIDQDMFRSAAPPELRCVGTDLDGNITITWKAPEDSVTLNNFSSYYIYTSTNLNGPYVLMDSVTSVNLNSYTHVGANGNTNQNYYTVTTQVDCDGIFSSDFSDTLTNIVLDLVMPSSQTANLSWNHPMDPLLPTHSGWYQLWREFPAGTWTLVDSTQQLAYMDTMLICHDTVNYRVEMYDSSGCYSVSSTNGDYFFDANSPDLPVLDSVSIDTANGVVILGWTPSLAGDVTGYIIYYNDGVWNPIDTVWGKDTSYYVDTDPLHSPCYAAQYYAMASIDSCGYTSSIGVNNIHNSIYLEITNYDPCQDEISLAWTEYQNFSPDIEGYRIFVSENGSPYTLLANNLAPAPGSPPDNTYHHTGLNTDSEYCYYVQAYVNDSLSSTSCKVCVVAEKAAAPDYLYIRYATVEDNDHVKLQLYCDTAAATDYYKVLRAASVNGPYDVIANIPFVKDVNISFEDHDAHFKRQSYFYKIVATDTCGFDSYTSELARTIYLTAEINDNFSNALEWNDYEGWSWAPLDEYKIYRVVDGMVDPIPVTTLPYGTNSYIDDVSGLTETEGKFSYLVEAIQGMGMPDFADTSQSNIANLLQRSRIFVPNAFSPKGYNDEFKPVQVFVDLSEYEFRIYNRWGQELFQTSDPERGWDGAFEGELVPGGAYVYYIRFITSTGDEYEKRGSVTVLY